MSAFLVEPEHIGQLVLWYQQNKSPGLNKIEYKGKDIFLDCKDLVLYLATANQDSISYKYKEPHDYSYCGDIWKYQRKVNYAVKISAGDAYNMANCLAYQSCEHPGYKGSAAETLLDMIKDTAARQMAAGSKVRWDYSDDFSEHGQISLSHLAKNIKQKGAA
jgi:hypothetical protein